MPSPADPFAFTLFGLAVRWYALFILGGIVAAVWLVRALARRRGMDPEFVLDIAPWIVFAGIVGARAYYLLLRWDYYVDHPGEAVNIRLGGLTIHGAIVAGLVTLAFFCWRRRQPFFAWVDVIVPGLALAQAVGRWGNWANQEAFGTPTDLPWGVEIAPDRRPAGFVDVSHFHPTFLYESLFNLANAAFLAWLVLRMPRARVLREGDVLWVYFVLYGTARFFIERIRTDSLYIGPLPAAYWLSFTLIGLGLTMLVLRRTVWPGRFAMPAHVVAHDDDTNVRARSAVGRAPESS